MKYKKTLTFLITIIIILAAVACLCGLMFKGGKGINEFKSIRGETIKIAGEGLYKYESKNQRLALNVQDMITLALGIPLLVISLLLAWKESLKGRLLLAGTLAYFLYTYISYAFLRIYNPLFLLYVILMTCSFLAFLLCMMSFEIQEFPLWVKNKMPVKLIGGYQLLLAAGLIFTWIPPIMDSLLKGTIPIDLEHYNSLGYEAIDLGFVVPVLIISAVLIINKKPFGYLLSSVIIMLSISMNLLISVLGVFQVLDGMKMPFILLIMFPVFTLITAFCLILLLKNLREPKSSC